MEDCVFCRIINKEQQRELLVENDDLVAFHDILPQAPVHILIVSKEHIPSLTHVEPWHQGLIGEMMFAARDLAKKFSIDQTGYKLITNVGPDGGQTVPHLHIHLVGGKKLD
jgi:histidine triad (HIT) family protein